jgi:DNA-binding LacI/PurR family transcriptional regulator
MPRRKKDSSVPDAPRRVTLQDIADVVGVHRMTVSDALNGTGSVAPATREQVRQVARELKYIPNFAARALSTGRTGIIAIVSGPINEPYYGNMVHLLEKHINAAGFQLMLIRTSHEVKDLVNATGNVAVDGAIAVDMFGLVKEFQSHPAIPCVSIGTLESSLVDAVLLDLSASVEEALEIMLKAGRKRIAYFVTATIMEWESEVRARTYFSVMRRAQRTPEVINVMTDVLSEVEGKLKAYLDKHGVPDALFCQNDETAMCAFRVLKDAGYSVPDDVLLVGCDGQAHMRYFEPPLSTIVQPMEEMCAAAWQFLQQRMANPNLPHQRAVLEGTLVVRKSLMANS